MPVQLFIKVFLPKHFTFIRSEFQNDKVTVAGLVLAGSADFKTELGQSDMFDQRLQVLHRLYHHSSKIYIHSLKAKIIKTVDISYGGENGFNQAIELAADALQVCNFHYFIQIRIHPFQNVKFIQEKKLISAFFEGLYLREIEA